MLSARGARWAKIGYAHGAQNRFHPTENPQGMVSFDNAENWLMHSDLTRFINKLNFDESCCAYGEGYTGTLRLRAAMANHINNHFEPAHRIDAEEITFAAGVTDLNEACALVTCNPDADEAIMLGRPVYGAFSRDLCMRTGVGLEYVPVGDTDQFSPACVAAFDAGYEAAKSRGKTVRALIICNPHNPLGQCYPRETLVGLLQLCARKGIHLISDEIYALSVYNRNDRKCEVFTSIRSIDFSGIIDPRQVHVLYGMSKDFGAGGMRLGCVISQNREFTDAVRSRCRFASPSQFSMEIAASLLEDQDYIRSFLEESHARLLQNRLLAESLLSRAGIDFHDKGNAGLFIWLDLNPFLPITETNGDGWSAQRLLSERLEQAGVSMSTGESYRAPEPGRFRLVFSLDEASLREGIRRISHIASGVAVE
ncbi:putative classes I and II family [Rosellinia necatrix]|uniref:Putative classes I and II family n=1 Tax=Rosellinia necatrix TaxID=77044 RepID=A0A1S7UL40_ROSNE|nr:putative classes I and II family [Rosellinia necatrix]